MSCFCHASMTSLTAMLPSLQVNATVAINLPGANIADALAAWLAAHALPAPLWTPDPAWLDLPLPQLRLSFGAVATISALAQLRAQVLAQLGLDLLNPLQARAFARVVATLNARMSALANLNFTPQPWLRLAALNSAIDQVNLALQAGLFLPSQSLLLSLTMPAGRPLSLWAAFLALLSKLLPMLAAATQLNVSLAETAQLSAALRMLARIGLPSLVGGQLMASLTAALSAIASLQASLGINPLTIPFPQLMLQIQAKLNLMLRAVASAFGITIAGMTPEALLAALLSLLPQLPVVPGGYITAPVVHAALNAQGLANLDWNVPLSLPVTQIGLPVCAFAAQLNAALGIQAVLPSPCSSGCDAAKIMSALSLPLTA